MPRATLDDDGVVLVAISGGKDGLATAVMLRASGRTVEGFHVAGINRGYPDELEYAEAACQALGIPLTVTTVRVTGRRSGFIEMPTKNQVIAGLMADHLVARGRGNGLAMGVVRADVPETMNPVLNWSDNTTAVARWSDFLYGVLGLDWYTPLRHETESVAVLLYHDMLHLAHGCMAPLRYRARLVATNQRRFGADSLLPGRCGSCVKCCGEVLVMDALGAPVAPGLVAHSVDFLADRKATEHPDDPAGDPRDHYVDQAVVRKYREGA